MTEVILNYVGTHSVTHFELINVLSAWIPKSYYSGGIIRWSLRLLKMGLIQKDEQGILYVDPHYDDGYYNQKGVNHGG